MLRPSSPADHDREATQTGRLFTSASTDSSVWAPATSGQVGEPPTFKHDNTRENPKSADRRLSNFIPNQTSKRNGSFAPETSSSSSQNLHNWCLAMSSLARDRRNRHSVTE